MLLPLLVLALGAFAQDEMSPLRDWGYNSNSNSNSKAVSAERAFDPTNLYQDPSNWGTVYAACGSGKLSEIQSPVNIDDSALVDPKLTAIRSDYVPSAKAAWTVTNNGHTLTAVPGDAVMTISGGPLGSSVFQVANVHFHWGHTSVEGSEHAFRGAKSPLETHIVHFNTKYANLSVAVNQPDGLAVIGVFSQLNSTASASRAAQTNSWVFPTEEALSRVALANTNFTIPSGSFELGKLLPPTGDYYTYKGSLTTPGCQESVLWIVMAQSSLIPEVHLARLRELNGIAAGEKIEHNFRPLQALNFRTIRAFQAAAAAETAAKDKITKAQAAGIALGALFVLFFIIFCIGLLVTRSHTAKAQSVAASSDQRGQQQKAPAPPSAPAMQQAHTRQPSPRSDLPQIVPKTAAPEPSASTHAFPVTPSPTAKNSAGKGSQKEQSVESSYSYDSYSSSSSE